MSSISVSASSKNESPPARPMDRGTLAFLGLVLFFLACRLPVMYSQPGFIDDECYAIPGLTILENGIPRLPHVAGRETTSVYYHADEVLYCEPPLMFYLQALFYLVLPHEYGTGRLVSAAAGIGVLAAVWRMASRLEKTWQAAIWAVGLFSASRWFYLSVLKVRPDMLCVMFGLWAIATMWGIGSRFHWRTLITTGILIGLGGLSHALALAYAVQIAVWLFVTGRGWQRLTRPALVAVVAVAVAAAWVPLILVRPDLFLIQFRNQYLGVNDDPLWLRLLWPWESIAYHAQYMVENFGPIQFPLVIGSLVACTMLCLRQRDATFRPLCWLGWTGFYLIACLVGPHHMTLGYWVYPAAFGFMSAGVLIDRVALAITAKGRFAAPLRWAGAGLLILLMLPGMGLKATVSSIRNWNDPDYRAPLMAKKLMDRLPADARYAVDPAFTLDFYAAGRKTLPAQLFPGYLPQSPGDYDYLIVSRLGVDDGMAQRQCAEKLLTAGKFDDLLACYAEVYRSTKSPCPSAE